MPATPPLLAIAVGDVTGIGIEVSLKAVAADLKASDSHYLLIGDEGYLARANKALGLNLSFGRDKRISILSPMAVPEGLSFGAKAAADAALLYLHAGAELCLRGKAQALITAPVSKEAIIRAGHSFVGQTEFLSGLADAKRTAMMLLGTDHEDRWIRVVLATTHVRLRDVASALTVAKVRLAIDLAVEACKRLRLPQARIAVCGLNPHAGEGGNMGTEEIDVISPAMQAARAPDRSLEGPLSADTVFYRVLKGEFDAVVAMYHDQGLAPLKMAAFETGVNWTLGLPFIRTSPDHGTAYDIVGKGIANSSSMLSAIRLARQLIANAQ